MATLSGKMLGNYQVGERIGRGGMADVYEGLHTRLGRPVAIKVLHPHMMEGEDFLSRFEREARAVAALRHPNIVQVFDFDTQDDIIYMVMEHVDGGSLQVRLQALAKRGELLPLSDALRMMRHVGEALDYAHQQDMVHRDVKPSNIILDSSGAAFLTDFGIVRIMSDTQFTTTGALIGTPAYMSPEQGRGETLTPASDIYSLGVILYEMLAGVPPYDADTPLAIIHKHINDPLPPLRDLRPDLPKAVESVVLQALAKQPDERFTSAGDLAVALGTALGDEAKAAIAPSGTDLPTDAVSLAAAEPETEALIPTVVMQEPADDEIADPDTMAPEAEQAPDRVPAEVLEAEGPPSSPTPIPTASSWRQRMPLIFGGIGLAAVIVVLAVSGVFQGGSEDPETGAASDCPNMEVCAEQASEAMMAGHFEDAISHFDRALDYVPPDEQPSFAHLWCERGEALMVMELPDEARDSFEQCLSWAGDAPEAEGARNWAQEMLR